MERERVPDAKVTVSGERGGRVGIAIEGEVDLGSVALLEEALAPVAGSDVVVDLSRCAFLDSSALRVLAVAAREARAAGRSLVVTDPSRPARRTLEIAGLTGLVPIAWTD